MKLIIAIVNYDDAGEVVRSLSKGGFSSTRLSTTGGFLLAGNVTLLIGAEAEKVDTVIGIIREHSHSRRQMIPASPDIAGYGAFAMPVEVTVGGATVFVLDVERFQRL